MRHRIIHGFKGHAGGHGTITNNCHHFTLLLLITASQRHAQTGRNRGG